MTYRKKLIEVALPLEAINKESVREKSIRSVKRGYETGTQLVEFMSAEKVPGTVYATGTV